MNFGLLVIATRRYKEFLPQLIEGVKQFFLPNLKIQIHLFIDDIDYEIIGNERVEIIKELIPAYKFPFATLYRYRIFLQKQYDCDYLGYIDADMKIIDVVDESILGNIVAVRHPGFDRMKGGSWEDNELSACYVFPENRNSYYAGGFNLGERKHYFRAMQDMSRWIDTDEKNGIIPVWNDESAFNRFLSEYKSFKELDSRYCMPEQINLRQAWNIDSIGSPFILALEKNHKEFQG